MAWLALGVFYAGAIVGTPVVTGVAQGVSEQKRVNAEAANEDRMLKFYLDVFCDGKSAACHEIHGSIIVLKHNKAWLMPKESTTLEPILLKDGTRPHPFTGFYIMYPDDDRCPAERGLVSTISIDPPMLNWLYVDKATCAVRYGNRTQSIEHIVGPWDWTNDEVGITLDGWEGFVAVREQETEDGLKWALYYDQWDDDFGNGRLVASKKRLQCSLERRVLPEELVKAQQAEVDKKMQVKTSGDLTAQWDV